MKTAQKLFSFFIVVILFGLAVQSAQAGQVTSYVAELSDTSPTATGTTHKLDFTHTSSTTLFSFRFNYCTTPSGTCTHPSALVTENIITEGTITGLDPLEWSVVTTTGSDGLVYLENHGDGEAAGATAISVSLGGITNHDINDCEAGNSTSDTCYIRLNSYSDIARTGDVDNGITSYTVVAVVNVRARVDPLFTFTISGTSANVVYNDITTSEATTFSELDFGNLTANTPKYVAHGLTVTTNTENGYTITQRMSSQMTGVYAANNIDPFAATGATWSTPIPWTEPTGSTASVDTGWIGANTNDADLTDFTVEEFGPVNTADSTVMSESGSDDGSTTVYVTFGIEANVFQPADTYAGILMYTALPTY